MGTRGTTEEAPAIHIMKMAVWKHLFRAFLGAIVVIVASGLLWGVCAPTVQAKRTKTGEIELNNSWESVHIFDAYAYLILILFIAGAVSALWMWLKSSPVRGALLIVVLLAGAYVGSFLALLAGNSVRAELFTGPGGVSGMVGPVAVRLSDSEKNTAITACVLGTAVVLFIAAAATPTLGSAKFFRRTQNSELISDT